MVFSDVMFKYEKILTPQYSDVLEQYYLSSAPKWNFYSNIDYGSDDINSPGFISQIAVNNITNTELNFVLPILYHSPFKIADTTIIRIKANLLLPNSTAILEPHVDAKYHHNLITLIYFVNDSEGPLQIFEEQNTATLSETPNKFNLLHEVEPVKNTMIWFNGNYYHKGSYPTETPRVTLNFTFLKQKDEFYAL